MTTHRDDFILWYHNEFRGTKLYHDMSIMVENSPWHRESDVGTHTDMVVAQYLARAYSNTWMNDAFNQLSMDRQYLLGAFAAAFHDVAKPHVVQYKESEERGSYKAFNGHEKVSARMWENWAVTNWPMLTARFGFTRWDLYAVGWMIEHHLPWDLKDQRKLDNLRMTALRCDIVEAFSTLLMADTTGRISDDAEQKIMKSQAWLDDFHDSLKLLMVANPELRKGSEQNWATEDQPRLVMPVAPSGSGKTTLFKEEYQDEGYAHFSLDEMRLLWAAEYLDFSGLETKEIYKYAWQYCAAMESEFKQFWQNDYRKAVRSGVNLFVDGTNLSAKARRFFLVEAENRGYWTVAGLFPVTLDAVYARQKRRPDKDVPHNSVKQQYDSLALPQYGEFDEIFIQGPKE